MIRGCITMEGKTFRTGLTVGLSLFICAVGAAQSLFDDFSTDPIGDGRFAINGPNTSEDAEGQSVPTFSWQDGTIVVNYNSFQPTTRLEATLPVTVDETHKFRFGASFTILSDGLVVNDFESYGFEFATFALLNSSLTGTDRDGMDAASSDAYSTVEFDYFPQDSSFFPTITLGPAVIAGRTSQSDFYWRIFFDFGPNTTLNDEIDAGLLPSRGLPLNTPLFAYIDYDGKTNPTHPTLSITVSVVTGGGLDQLPTGVPIFDLTTSPYTDFSAYFDGFSCDKLAIVNYQEHPDPVWGPFNPSHIGTVVFDSIFFEVDDPTGDPDGDGLSNEMEELLGTDPDDPDTDGDMVNDGDDAFPLNPHGHTNADGDNLGDEFEQLIVDAYPGYDDISDVGPDDDPDGDGTSNIMEFQWGTDPTDAASRVPLGIMVTVLSVCAILAVGVVASIKTCVQSHPMLY